MSTRKKNARPVSCICIAWTFLTCASVKSISAITSSRSVASSIAGEPFTQSSIREIRARSKWHWRIEFGSGPDDQRTNRYGGAWSRTPAPGVPGGVASGRSAEASSASGSSSSQRSDSTSSPST